MKAAFRELALKTHPDVCSDPAASARFHRGLAAYQSLLAHEHAPVATLPSAPAAGWARAAARSAGRRTALAVCGATFVAGIFVFAGAFTMHTRWDLYSGNRFVAPDTSNEAVRAAVARRRRSKAEQ